MVVGVFGLLFPDFESFGTKERSREGKGRKEGSATLFI